MNDTQNKLRDVVKDLFTGDKIDLLIGHGKGTLPLRSRPCFITAADDADRLVWNASCSSNLAVFLPRYFEPKPHRKGEETPPPRIGIVAKGCDVRSIIGLGQALQIPVIAEGVETEAEHAFLWQEGCTEMQGYLVGHPLPIADYAMLVDPQDPAAVAQAG